MLSSPQVYREHGYRFAMFFNDHPPPHVHVYRSGLLAEFALSPVGLRKNRGFKPQELNQIKEIVERNAVLLLEEWHAVQTRRR